LFSYGGPAHGDFTENGNMVIESSALLRHVFISFLVNILCELLNSNPHFFLNLCATTISISIQSLSPQSARQVYPDMSNITPAFLHSGRAPRLPRAEFH
jgi:hypothetical protein